MPDTATLNVREAESQLSTFRSELVKLRQDFESDGDIDREEEQILSDIESMIAEVETRLAERKTAPGGDDASGADGDAGRQAWEARKSEYRQLIVSADALQNEGNTNAPTLTKFLNRIDDAVAEDRWGEAVELLELAQMTLRSATGGAAGTDGEDDDPGRAKWADLSGDYDGVVRQINTLRANEHPDIERFEDFVTQMDRAAREERWNDAIATLDLAQSALGAAGYRPEGAGEGPEAADALRELAERETASADDGIQGAQETQLAGEPDADADAEEDGNAFWHDEWNRRWREAQALGEASLDFEERGYDEADELSKLFEQLQAAEKDEDYSEAIDLLDAGLALMRAIKRRHGEEPGEDQGGESDWEDRIADHERLQRTIERLENSEDYDDADNLEELSTFNRLVGEAVADGRYSDAIKFLDSALIIIPPNRPGTTPSDDTPPHTTDPVVPGATGGTEDEDEEEWLQMARQFTEFQQLMQQLMMAGHSAAIDIATLFSDILKARSESRWQDAIMLLTNALASARALAREIADTPPPNTTDPVVPGITPDGPGGTEPVDPGRINPSTASISGSVGRGGRNGADDVRTVQQLLNQNGASPALEVDGAVGPKTIGAISKFQQEALGFQDGRVDPGGQTWGALTSGGGAGAGAGAAAGGGAAGPGDGGADGGSAEVPAWVNENNAAVDRHEIIVDQCKAARDKGDDLKELDPPRADQIYGEAYALKQEIERQLGGYVPPAGNAGQSEWEDKTNQLNSFHSLCTELIGLFRAGDAQWDYSEYPGATAGAAGREAGGAVGGGAATGDMTGIGGGTGDMTGIGGGGDIGLGGMGGIMPRVDSEAYLKAVKYEGYMHNWHKDCYENPQLIGKANALNQQDPARAVEIYGEAWTKRALGKEGYDSYPGITDPTSDENCNQAFEHSRNVYWNYQNAIELFQEGDRQWGAQPPSEEDEGDDPEVARLRGEVAVAEALMYTSQGLMFAAETKSVYLMGADPNRFQALYGGTIVQKNAALQMMGDYRTPGADADVAELERAKLQAELTKMQCDTAAHFYRQADATWDYSEYEEGGAEDDSSIVDDVLDAVDELVDDAEEAIDDVIDEAERLRDRAENAVEDLVDDVEDEIDDLVDEAEDMVDDFIDEVEEDVEEIIDDAEDMIDEAGDMIDEAADEAEEFVDDVLDFFSDDDDDD
jgi:peptidoglycan hydrolase-like protein with peptidoglycan-binding domain/ElaB/YqjD/DUF883 family membrane-anchored ribosome-binding protein